MMRTESLPSTADAGWQTIWKLSWPLLLNMGVGITVLLVDSWMASWFGSTAQAGVAMAGQIAFLYLATTNVVTIGVTALTSRAIGAEDWDTARKAAGQALWLAALIALGFGVPLYWSGPWLLRAMGIGPDVVLSASQYLRVALGSVPAMAIWGVTTALMRARGDSQSQFRGSLLQAFGIIGLEWLAVHQNWGVPGLAMANVVGDWLVIIYGWRRLLASPLGAGLRGWPRPDRAILGRIVRIGFPAGVQGLLRSSAGVAYSSAVAHAPQSTAALAALTIGGRIESLAFLPAFALGLAASTLVGQNLGAQRPDQARQYASRITKAALMLSLPACLLFLLGGRIVAGCFSTDAAVIDNATGYLWWMGITEPALIAGIVGTSVLQGAGDTRFPLVVTIFSQYVFRLPLAYSLVPSYGATGAWVAMGISMIVSGLLVSARVRWGRWTQTVV